MKKKKIVIILVCALALVAIIFIWFRKDDINRYFKAVRAEKEFNSNSLEYSWVDDYDYSKEIEEIGHITEKGAIKIAKEYVEAERISNVSCEYVENGEIYQLGFESEKHDIKTYWSLSITTGYDYACGHDSESWLKVDYYTGKVLSCVSTM